jgi:hypothetical protein
MTDMPLHRRAAGVGFPCLVQGIGVEASFRMEVGFKFDLLRGSCLYFIRG